jgi:hypothetical protein
MSAAPHVANHDKVFVLCDSPQYARATGTATYRRPYYFFTWITAAERLISHLRKIAEQDIIRADNELDANLQPA